MELGSAENFDRSGTLGIEEEFYVVDDAGQPTAGTDELVYERSPPAILEGRLDHELFTFVIETQTPVIESMAAAPGVLAAVREALVAHAEAHGYRIAAAGLHPTADWRSLEHVTKPRYRSQLDRIQYPQHRNITAGLHVHVGVDDADKATWIANELRIYLPVLLALSANSPYWCGIDTGLASARAKIFEALPNTGMPTAFDSFREYADLERWMVESDSIADRGELWYDVRPHSVHGTVEVRTPDAHADEQTVLAFVEYVAALVADLGARYEDGESGTTVRREYLDESKWRAMRHGHDAALLTAALETVDLGELVDRECSRLGVSGIRAVYDAGSGASRQRRRRQDGGFDAVRRSLLL